MMSAGLNAANGDDGTMPGDYESWPAPGARRMPIPQLGPIVPPGRTPFPQLPATGGPGPGVEGRTPFPAIPPTARVPRTRGPIVPRAFPRRPHPHRRRAHTPNIIIERGPRPRSSWGCDRVITVPYDCRPTLGLRGPPRRYIEIERIPCRRRHRRSRCYEYDYDHPPPPLQQPITVAPQQPIMLANPTTNFSPGQTQPIITMPINHTTPAVAIANPISNLSPGMLHNLPKQIVHLPAIHLPGSQADENTELQTITFPAEVINPATGALSVIQNNMGVDHGIEVPTSFQPQLMNLSGTTGAIVPSRGVPLSPAMAADPFTQRFQDLFQRLAVSHTQPTPAPTNPPIIRPPLPTMSEFDPTSNIANNRPTLPTINPISAGNYPPANIRPTNPVTTRSYPPPTVVPTTPSNMPNYLPSTFTPSRTATNATYRPNNVAPADISDAGPYKPANITPYTSTANPRPNNPQTTSSLPSVSTVPSGPRTPSPQIYPSSSRNYENSSSFPSASAALSGPRTPFPQIYPSSSRNYENSSSLPSASAAPSGPRTPFPQIYPSSSRNYENSSSFPSASAALSGPRTPFPQIYPSSSRNYENSSSLPSASAAPSGPRTPFPQMYPTSTNNYENSSSVPFNSSRSMSSTPKSILRNAPSINPPVNAYINLDSPIRKTARFT